MRKIFKKLILIAALIPMCLILSASTYQEDIANYNKSFDSISNVIKNNGMITDVICEKAKKVIPLTDEEIDLIALVTMAEAEGECELGKRLVIDTILNRVESDRFPDTVTDVIYAKNQFSSMWNGRVDRCYVRDDICELVRQEAMSRTNEDVLFFTSIGYLSFSEPLFQVGNHYFSTL